MALPAVDRMTDRCKNITLPQLCLQAVINLLYILTSMCGLYNRCFHSFQTFLPCSNIPSTQVLNLKIVLFAKSIQYISENDICH